MWQTKLQDLLKDLGYQPLTSDSAVYINPKKKLFITTFVDDYIIIGPNKKNIKALKAQLRLKYTIKNRGPTSYFLGVEILKDKANRLLYLNQRNYISEVLKHFNFNNSKRIKIPLQPGLIKDVNNKFTALKRRPRGKVQFKTISANYKVLYIYHNLDPPRYNLRSVIPLKIAITAPILPFKYR